MNLYLLLSFVASIVKEVVVVKNNCVHVPVNWSERAKVSSLLERTCVINVINVNLNIFIRNATSNRQKLLKNV